MTVFFGRSVLPPATQLPLRLALQDYKALDGPWFVCARGPSGAGLAGSGAGESIRHVDAP